MTQPDNQIQTDLSQPRTTSPLGHSLLFVIFSFGAFALFAPVVLLPLIRDHCQVLADEIKLREENAILEKELARRDAMVEAFKKDAIVNERLAVLDLHYNNPQEETVAVLPPDFAIPPEKKAGDPLYQSVLKIPETAPGRIRVVEAWAQQRGLIDLMLDPTLRPVLLLMSCGLIIAAFVLFAPRIHPETVRVVEPEQGPSIESSTPSPA